MAELSKLFGIKPEEVEAIQGQGMETVEDFYEVAKHPESRTDLSNKTGVDGFRLEELSSVAGNYLLMMDCAWDDDDEE